MVKRELVGALGYALKEVQHSLRRKMDEKLQPLGLSSSQYAVLRALEEEPGASNAHLARRCFITPQSMHGIVSLLEKRELIARTPDAEHGRKQLTQLTAEGARIVAAAHNVVAEIETRLDEAVAPLERTEVLDMLHRWQDQLERA